MEENNDINFESNSRVVIHSKKLILWLFTVTIVMIFAALTSAYIVRKADGEWLLFQLPVIFTYSTFIILASSVTLQLGYVSLKKGDQKKSIIYLATTLVLGIAFLYTQLKGWGALVDDNVFFGGSSSNPSGSFVYVLSGLHAFHLVTGLIYLIVVLILGAQNKLSKENSLQYELCTTYWHFLDLLWIYLFVFLMYNNNL